MRKTLNNNERSEKLLNLNSRCGLFIELLIVHDAFFLTIWVKLSTLSLSKSKFNETDENHFNVLFVESVNCTVGYYGIIRTCITASILSNNSLTRWMNRNCENGEQHSKTLYEHKLIETFMFLFLFTLFIQSTFSFSTVSKFASEEWKFFACCIGYVETQMRICIRWKLGSDNFAFVCN